MRVSLLSLGCPKNLADSEGLLKKLTASGIGFTEDPGAADVMLVNTCGFIEDAKKE
jgi:ribosomal protein S12 methylthiotransferase